MLLLIFFPCLVWYGNRWLKIILSHLYSWIKYISGKPTGYIPKFWEWFIKRTPNLNFIRIIKNLFFDQSFVCIWSKHFENLFALCWQFLTPRSEHLLISSATLTCTAWNISTVSILVYNKKTSLFSYTKSFSCTGLLVQCFIKCFSEVTSSLRNFIVSCCSLI